MTTVQNFDHPSDKRLITGNSGTGKSTLFLKMIKKQKARLKFIYDHQGEFAHKLGIVPVQDCAALCEATARGGFVIFDPLKMFSGRLPEGFSFFCDYVFEISTQIKGRKLLCCDELQKLTDNKNENPELQNVCDSGRRFQVDFFCISQAPNALHNRVRGQITEVYTFQQTEDCAVQYLVGNGFPEQEVRTLRLHKYLYKNLRTGQNNFSSSDAKPETQPERKADSEAIQPGHETNSGS